MIQYQIILMNCMYIIHIIFIKILIFYIYKYHFYFYFILIIFIFIFIFFFKKKIIRSLNDNSLSDMQYIENVKDFSNIDDTVIFYDDDDDDDDGAVLAMVIIIFCFLFFIPTALILSTYNDTSSHEAYLNLRNQIHAQYQNYEQLPDYNEVIADSQQGLPGYDYQEDSDYQQNIPIIDSQRDLPNYGSQQDLPPPNYESQEDTLNYESQEDTSNYDAPPDYEEIVS